jgi:hypothetical protein
VAKLKKPGAVCHVGWTQEGGRPLATIGGSGLDGVSFSEKLDIATLRATPEVVDAVDRSEHFRVVRPRAWPLLPRVGVDEPLWLGGYPKSLITSSAGTLPSGMAGKIFMLMRTGFGVRVRSVADDQFHCGPMASQKEPDEIPKGFKVGGMSGAPVFVERRIEGVHQVALCGVVKQGSMYRGRWLSTFVCSHVDSLQPDGSIDEDAPKDLSGGFVRGPVPQR